jgi:thymidylate synthase (FAD)
MISMTVEIKTSRAIAAQILRHRSFSFQEFSQRYSAATELEYIELRKQGKTNRQVGDEPIDIGSYLELKEEIEQAQNQCVNIYNKLIAKGIAKECARMLLPLNTQTTLYMSGTIRSWIHYIDLRATQDTQKEHREIAVEIKNLFISNFPNISKALKWLD